MDAKCTRVRVRVGRGVAVSVVSVAARQRGKGIQFHAMNECRTIAVLARCSAHPCTSWQAHACLALALALNFAPPVLLASPRASPRLALVVAQTTTPRPTPRDTPRYCTVVVSRLPPSPSPPGLAPTAVDSREQGKGSKQAQGSLAALASEPETLKTDLMPVLQTHAPMRGRVWLACTCFHMPHADLQQQAHPPA